MHTEARIIILGLDNSGKTAIYNKLQGIVDQDYKKLLPTGGFYTRKVKYQPDGTSGNASDGSSGGAPGGASQRDYTLDLWDIGGKEKIRPYWQKYTKTKDGVIFVIDSSDNSRLEEAIGELKNILAFPDFNATALPYLILASK